MCTFVQRAFERYFLKPRKGNQIQWKSLSVQLNLHEDPSIVKSSRSRHTRVHWNVDTERLTLGSFFCYFNDCVLLCSINKASFQRSRVERRKCVKSVVKGDSGAAWLSLI